MTVTGRSYPSARARGFVDWKPQRKTRELLAAVLAVLEEYAAQGPMTVRQVFYRLVGLGKLDKTENAYERLLEHAGKARRAGMIPMSAIRDDGETEVRPRGWESPDQLIRSIRGAVNGYRPNGLQGQPNYIEVHVEAAGMVPMVARMVDAYGISVYSSSGFAGIASKHAMAERLAGEHRQAVILHVGDYDPSGCSIIDSMAEDVDAFYAAMTDGPSIKWVRVAVTPEQIERYGLETVPQKDGDKRGEQMGETVQAEALSPTQLEAEIRQAVLDHLDLDIYDAVMAQGEQDRAELLASDMFTATNDRTTP